MRPLRSLLLATALLAPTVAGAQQDVGQAVVDGEPVTLFSDGTWRFDTPLAPGSCHPVAVDISFCGDPAYLVQSPSSNPDVQVEFRLGDRLFGAVLSERVGSRDGATTALFRRIILENAARVLDGPPEQIPVLDNYDLPLGDRVLDTIVYQGSVDGLEFVYANSILLDDTFSAQFMTWAVGSDFGDEHRAAHTSFVTSFEIGE